MQNRLCLLGQVAALQECSWIEPTDRGCYGHD